MSKYLDQLNSKNTLTDADQFVIIDSQDNNNNKRVTKAVMATVFGGGGGSSELTTNTLVYTGSDIQLGNAAWTDIQSMNLQAGLYLLISTTLFKRLTTSAQLWEFRLYDSTNNAVLAGGAEYTPSMSVQYATGNLNAIIELTGENTTIKVQARATSSTLSYATKDSTNSQKGTIFTSIKLDGISGGSSYSLPIANETTLGGIKTDMNKKGIAVSGTGIIGFVDDVFGDIEIVYDNDERLSFKLNGECVNEVNLALSDNEYKNSDTSRHGLMPKLNGEDNNVLSGLGAWTTGLIYKGQLSDKDINDSLYARDGYYHLANNCTNVPVPGKDHILLSMWLADGAYQYAYVLDASIRKVYIRYYDDLGSNFYPWTEIGSGGSLPTDNWLLGNGSIDLYNMSSLLNIINGESIDFQSEMYNNRINGTNISDNGAGNPMVNNSVNGDNIIIKDVNNSSIVGKKINVEKVNSSIVSGRNHNIGLQPDSTDVRNVKVSGLGVNNAWHSNAEYLSHGDNENVLVNPIFQNTKFTGKSRYIVQDGNSSIESFFINVGGLLDPTIILIDPSIQFVSIDLHITYIFSKANKDNRIQLSFTTVKSTLLVDMYNYTYSYRVINSQALGLDIVSGINFITELRGEVWNHNMGYLQLMGSINPYEFFAQTSENPTGYTLDTYITAEMHTIKNDVMYGN